MRGLFVFALLLCAVLARQVPTPEENAPAKLDMRPDNEQGPNPANVEAEKSDDQQADDGQVRTKRHGLGLALGAGLLGAKALGAGALGVGALGGAGLLGSAALGLGAAKVVGLKAGLVGGLVGAKLGGLHGGHYGGGYYGGGYYGGGPTYVRYVETSPVYYSGGGGCNVCGHRHGGGYSNGYNYGYGSGWSHGSY